MSKTKTLHLVFHRRNNKELTAVAKSSAFRIQLSHIHEAPPHELGLCDSPINPYSGRSLGRNGQGQRHEAQTVTQGMTDHGYCKKADFFSTQRGPKGGFYCKGLQQLSESTGNINVSPLISQTSMGGVNTGLSPTHRYKN